MRPSAAYGRSSSTVRSGDPSSTTTISYRGYSMASNDASVPSITASSAYAATRTDTNGASVSGVRGSASRSVRV
jgi:hypothetical protein